MDDTTAVLFKNINAYCESRDVTIKTFERFCGIANGVVARWGKGEMTPTLRTLDKVQSATGIPIGRWIKKGGIN